MMGGDARVVARIMEVSREHGWNCGRNAFAGWQRSENGGGKVTLGTCTIPGEARQYTEEAGAKAF
jgi:hypothetical protein